MNKLFTAAFFASIITFVSCNATKEEIPLPEHPRPDFERSEFKNLNGYWNFTFSSDTAYAAIAAGNPDAISGRILVPFPWGSKLSEVEDKGDIAWYGRNVTVPSDWKGKRIFLVVGASDWETTAWFDGRELGSHQGGYTPFEFEITEGVHFGEEQNIFFKVEDETLRWRLYGKQGYGNARGIWQTVYLEARGNNYIKSLHFTPDIDSQKVSVDAQLAENPVFGTEFRIEFKNREYESVVLPCSEKSVHFEIPMPDQHLWSLDDPYLYEVTASVVAEGVVEDAVSSYFGQRKIGVVDIPGQGYKYVSLNNSPIYLQLCLDQSYHPDGYYTFPSDDFMKNEILISKNLGLNGNRIHIKTEVPRKLYWADKLGLLIMADVPNFWGAPDSLARDEWEKCMRAQLERDFNHPSIFAWVDFNETWGLVSDGGYQPETQEWVRNMYLLTKKLDPTRLVEDNSACNNDHVQTDINSWHSYRQWFTWEKVISRYDSLTFVGGHYNYIGDNKIQDVPMINSECGNVWGYDGSAGDCDFTWDYHEMMNAFHRHPKVAGWLYTEHHDVINEWNGYVRFDRTEKFDGLSDIVPGMSLKDFHSPYYIVPDGPFSTTYPAGSVQTVKLYSSFVTDKNPGDLTLETSVVCTNSLGEEKLFSSESVPVQFVNFCKNFICDRIIDVPCENGLYVLRMLLKNSNGEVLHRNFNTFVVKDAQPLANTVSFAPSSYSASQWSIQETSILDGLKINGFGSGYFEYSVKMPESLDLSSVKSAQLVFEASAKQLFGKDINDGTQITGDFMLGGGTWDPCKNRNSYAMTDTVLWPSEVRISINGSEIGEFSLPDDPADHRGLLSWNSQLTDKYLREAGSFGYLVKATIPVSELSSDLVIRLTVPQMENGGGLAIYGKDFGRYPLDPTIVLEY